MIDGPLVGYTFVTDSSGRAVLPPVAAAGSVIHLKKPGFENLVHRITELPRELALPIELIPEFGQIRRYSGGCEAGFTGRLFEDRFSTPRFGKVRLRIEFDTLTLHEGSNAQVNGSVGTSAGGHTGLIVTAFEITSTGPRPGVLDVRLPANDYVISFRGSGCVSADRWRATLEYSR